MNTAMQKMADDEELAIEIYWRTWKHAPDSLTVREIDISAVSQALAIGREQGRSTEWERCEKLFSMIKIPHEPTYTKEYVVAMLDTLITEYAALLMDAITTDADIDSERLFDLASPPKTQPK